MMSASQTLIPEFSFFFLVVQRIGDILIPWLQRRSYITFFTLVGDISRRQVIFHVGR